MHLRNEIETKRRTKKRGKKNSFELGLSIEINSCNLLHNICICFSRFLFPFNTKEGSVS